MEVLYKDTIAYTQIEEIPAFSGLVSTTENVALYIDKMLRPLLDQGDRRLSRIEVAETRNNNFEIEMNAT